NGEGDLVGPGDDLARDVGRPCEVGHGISLAGATTQNRERGRPGSVVSGADLEADGLAHRRLQRLRLVGAVPVVDVVADVRRPGRDLVVGPVRLGVNGPAPVRRGALVPQVVDREDVERVLSGREARVPRRGGAQRVRPAVELALEGWTLIAGVEGEVRIGRLDVPGRARGDRDGGWRRVDHPGVRDSAAYVAGRVDRLHVEHVGAGCQAAVCLR